MDASAIRIVPQAEPDPAPQDARAGSGSIRLGGQVFLVGQPTPADMKSVGVYLKRRAKRPLAALVEDPAFAKLSQGVQDQLTLQAGKEQLAGELRLTQEEAFAQLCTVEGTRYLAWLLIRKAHPEVTLETFGPPGDTKTGLINEHNIDAVFVELDEGSGMSKLGNSAGQSG